MSYPQYPDNSDFINERQVYLNSLNWLQDEDWEEEDGYENSYRTENRNGQFCCQTTGGHPKIEDNPQSEGL